MKDTNNKGREGRARKGRREGKDKQKSRKWKTRHKVMARRFDQENVTRTINEQKSIIFSCSFF